MKPEPITVNVNRLWNGYADVRSYIVDKARLTGRSILITLGETGEQKFFSHEDGIQINSTEFKSKYDNETYTLVSFEWAAKKVAPKFQGMLFE